MTKSKNFYKSLNLEGFTWYMFDRKTKLHHFQRGEGRGWRILKCTDDDIDTGHILDMIETGTSL